MSSYEFVFAHIVERPDHPCKNHLDGDVACLAPSVCATVGEGWPFWAH